MPLPLRWTPPSEGIPVTEIGAKFLAPIRGLPQNWPANQPALPEPDPWVDEAVAIDSAVRRIVLYPQGAPIDRRMRSLCSEQLVRGGGDPRRTFDVDPGSLNRFIEHAASIEFVRSSPASRVVLTKLEPIAYAVVVTRRRIENAIPMLREAVWVLFVSPDQQERFIDEAQAFGGMCGSLDSAPIWVGPGDRPFLILSPCIASAVDLRRRVVSCHERTAFAAGAPHYV